MQTLTGVRSRLPWYNSPIPDFESFYYAARWAAAFNEGASGGKYHGDGIQEMRKLIMEKYWVADGMIRGYCYSFWEERQEEYGPFFVHSVALFQPWLQKLSCLSNDWESVVGKAEGSRYVEKDLTYNYLVYAYRGVGEYFELLHQHRALLQAPGA